MFFLRIEETCVRIGKQWESPSVRPSFLSSAFLLWFWKTWCGAPKCWGGSCSWMTQRCVLQCQVLRLVFQVFCLQICAPSPISRREVKSDNESFVFLRMNICKCSMWKDFFLFYVSQEFFSKSKTIHSTNIHPCWFLKRCPVVLKPSFRTWFLRVFFCRSWDLFQSSHLQM